MNHHRELSSQRAAEPYGGSRDRLCPEPTVSAERQSRGHVSQRAGGGSLEKAGVSDRKSDVPGGIGSLAEPPRTAPCTPQPLGKSLHVCAIQLDGLSHPRTHPGVPDVLTRFSSSV